MNIKQKGIEILREYRKGKYSNIILDEYIRKNKFTQGEKKFLTEIFYGVIRNEIYIDYIINKYVKTLKKDWLKELLKISIYQLTYMDSDDKGVVWEGTELAKKKFGVPIGKFINGVLRNYQRDKSTEREELVKNNRLDILYSCPTWFYNIIKENYTENIEDYLKSIKKIPYISFRVNLIKWNECDFQDKLQKEGINVMKKVGSVFYLDSGAPIHWNEFKEGKIIVQDGASYIAAKNLNPKSGEIVIDACSAPGGKTVVLGELMENKGEILAFDIHQHKLKLVEENAKKMGIEIIKVVKMDARKIGYQGKKFDKILVDAPCSGYGVLRKKPEILYNKEMKNIEDLREIQYEILQSVSESLKVGGELLYSTCTITKEENTGVLKKFLEKNKNFTVEKLDIPDNVSGFYDSYGGFQIDYKEEFLDSFYMVKLKKNN